MKTPVDDLPGYKSGHHRPPAPGFLTLCSFLVQGVLKEREKDVGVFFAIILQFQNVVLGFMGCRGTNLVRGWFSED